MKRGVNKEKGKRWLWGQVDLGLNPTYIKLIFIIPFKSTATVIILKTITYLKQKQLIK